MVELHDDDLIGAYLHSGPCLVRLEYGAATARSLLEALSMTVRFVRDGHRVNLIDGLGQFAVMPHQAIRLIEKIISSPHVADEEIGDERSHKSIAI